MRLTYILPGAVLVFFAGFYSQTLLAPAAETPAGNDGLDATLWIQTAVEYKTTALSVYAGATRQLDALLADTGETAAVEQTGDFAAKPPAVILDIDETVLNNSAYQAWVIARNKAFSPETWHQFVEDEISKPVPGAVAFTKAAAAKGITVFYVSNRDATEEEATREALQKYGFPIKDGEDVVLLRNEKPEWTGKKSTRRAAVAEKYRILALFGDNFTDFLDSPGSTIGRRAATMHDYDSYWGERWFSLPNPTYGSWQSAAVPKGGPLPRHDYLLDALQPWPGPKPAAEADKTAG